MTLIRALFARDPDREIVGVVKIDDHDPERVWSEMDEYVATEEVRGFYRELVDRYLETRRRAAEDVCVWVSGFFGSGKSHFLKVLGYLLENRMLRGSGGVEVSSVELLCSKLGLGSLAPLLAREFQTWVFYINLLNHDAQAPARPTISRLVYRELLESKGLSKDFWVAAWEQEIQSLGRWEEFTRWVQERYGRSWEKERRLNADGALAEGLPVLFPGRFPEAAAARRALDDSKQSSQEVRPQDVARRLRQEAESLDPVKGRIIVLLDEVGLYIGDSIERLTDLNSLAEQVVVEGGGKVWLVVSAQEALAELVPRLTTDRQILAWLQDRFSLRFQLTPSNIEQVVSERLLKKRPEAVVSLGDVYARAAGLLAAGAGLQGVATGRLDPSISQERFAAFYPMLPHYLLLLHEAFSSLRQKGVGGEEARRRLGGRERSMLQTVQAVLRGEGILPALADMPVGRLATFDLLYDAVSSELSIIQSDHHNAITHQVAAVDSSGGMPPAAVAKALFLLQQVGEWLPCSLENIAAVLYPELGTEVTAHRQAVCSALEALRMAGWVVEEEGRYRFLSPAEHDFEREIRANQPSPAEKKQEVINLMRQKLNGVRYQHGTRAKTSLDVAFKVDGQEMTTSGDLRVYFYTPLASADKDEALAESISTGNTLFWLAAQEASEFEMVLVRVLAIEKALGQWQARVLSPEQESYVAQLRQEAAAKRIRLSDLLEQAFLSGTFLVEGTETPVIAGSSFSAEFQSGLHPIANRLFTEFLDVQVERDEDCTKILSWRPGVELPQVYADQGLVGSGVINQDCRAAALVLAELKRRQDQGLERTGSALAAHFRKSPYGWDPRLVRLVLAALLKNGSVAVVLANTELTAPEDPQVREVFASHRRFNAATFKLLPQVDWRKVREMLVTIFGQPAGDTFEQVAEQVRLLAARLGPVATRLVARAQDIGLPLAYGESCRIMEQVFKEIENRGEANARMRFFLEQEEKLQQHAQLFRRLQEFEVEFERYREFRSFVAVASAWAREGLPPELQSRWASFTGGLEASDLLERWNDLVADFTMLRAAYRAAYDRRHAEFQAKAAQALEELAAHPAIPPGAAEGLLQPLRILLCPAAGAAAEQHLACPACQRSYVELDPAVAERVRRSIVAELDSRLSPPGNGLGPRPEPFQARRVVTEPAAVETLLGELQGYVRRCAASGYEALIEITAKPKGASE